MQQKSTGNLIVDHHIKKGGVVMTSDVLEDHLDKLFGSQATDKKEVVIVPVNNTVPFKLERQDEKSVELERSKRRGKGKKKIQDSAVEGAAQPNMLVEYAMELATGPEINIPEYAFVFKKNDETILIGYPISKKDRIKPTLGSSIKIKHAGIIYSCYTLGIHTDIPEWGVSISVYLVNPNE